MLLAIDMGNTNIEFGLLDGEKTVFSERIKTDLEKTAMEYAVLLHNILEIRNIDLSNLDGAIISSVVPPLTTPLKEAVKKATGITPLIVGPGIKTGLKIKIGDAKEITIRGSQLSPGCYPSVIDGFRQKLYHAEHVVSHTFPLSEWEEAYRTARTSDAVKVVLIP